MSSFLFSFQITKQIQQNNAPIEYILYTKMYIINSKYKNEIYRNNVCQRTAIINGSFFCVVDCTFKSMGICVCCVSDVCVHH